MVKPYGNESLMDMPKSPKSKGVTCHTHLFHIKPMTLLLVLAFSLAVALSARKLFAKKQSPQREEPKSIPLDPERPRALSYTEMMNSGRQSVM